MTTTNTDPGLTPFEGSPVVAAKIEIPDAAGGLRDAMAVAPVELHHGEEGIIALRYRVRKVRFDPSTGKRAVDGDLVRVHVFETLEAAFIDDNELDKQIRQNADRVKREVERLSGVQRLDDALDDDVDPDVQAMMDDEDAAALVKAHEMGMHHGGAVVGCSACAERESDRAGDERGRADLV